MRQLRINVDISTKSRGLQKAEMKILNNTSVSIVDVEHTFKTTYTGIGSVCLDGALLDKYGITNENIDSIDINLYKIIEKEFCNDNVWVCHLEAEEEIEEF